MAVAGPLPKSLAETEKEWDQVPLFMRSLPEDDDNVALQALQSLVYEGTPEETATTLRLQANQYFKAKKYKEAMGFYTQAINEVGKELSVDTRRTLFANRAACHLELHNYGSCLRDCGMVISLGLEVENAPAAEDVDRRQTTLKALYRSARALLALERYEDTQDVLARMTAQGEADVKLESEVAKRMEMRDKKAAALAETAKRKEAASSQLKAALQQRSIVLPLHWTLESASIAAPSDVRPPHFDDDTLCLPVFLLRPTAHPPTRDLILSWAEDVTLAEQFDAFGSGLEDRSLECYLVTARQRILKLGRKLTLRSVFAAAVPKADGAERDGVFLRDGWCIELYVVPKPRAEEWIAEMKRSLKS